MTLDDLGDERLSVSSAQHNGFYTSSAATLDACPPCSSGDVADALCDVIGIAFPAGASRDLHHVLTTVACLFDSVRSVSVLLFTSTN